MQTRSHRHLAWPPSPAQGRSSPGTPSRHGPQRQADASQAAVLGASRGSPASPTVAPVRQPRIARIGSAYQVLLQTSNPATFVEVIVLDACVVLQHQGTVRISNIQSHQSIDNFP